MNKHQYYAGDGQAQLANEHDKKVKAGRVMDITDDEFIAKLSTIKSFKEACGFGDKNNEPF